MNTRAALFTSVCTLALLASDAEAAVDVGVAAAVNQSAEATPPGGSVRSMSLGDNVIHNERIATGPEGLVQILLVDGTTFTVGANSDLVIDKFVYDPNAGTAEVVASFTKGALRFIGGRSSKSGGATINTPVGTVGIRGGMIDLVLGNTSEGVPPNLVNCVFGTCSVGDTTFQAGQSAYPDSSGNIVVVTTTEAMAAAGTTQVGSSNSTQNGGSTNQPTNQSVGQSQLAQENSSQPPETYNPPAQTGSFGDTGTQGTTEPPIAQEAAQSPPPPPTPQHPHAPVTMRIMTAGATFTPFFSNDPIPNAAALGLVGGPGHDENVVFNVPNSFDPALFVGTGTLTGAAPGLLRLPIYVRSGPDAELFQALDTPFGSPIFGRTLELGTDFEDFGIAFLNDGFAFYTGFYNVSGEPYPFYALTGTPTDFEAVFGSGTPHVRRYEFDLDPIQQVPVPFFRDGLLEFTAGDYTASDFYVVESPDLENQSVRMIQAWFQISGRGEDQQSGIGVTAGDFEPLQGGEAYGFRSGRTGSYRSAAADTDTESNPASLFYGGLNTVAGPGGGTEIFGPNGTNFVLSTNITGADAFGDVSVDAAAHFNTVHVANLVEEDVEFSANASSRTLTGFSAGMVEEYGLDRSYSVAPMFSGSASGIVVRFDANSHTLAGEILVHDPFDWSILTLLQLGFGNGLENDGEGDDETFGSSVYINDDLFAAGTNFGEAEDEGDPDGREFLNSRGVTDNDVLLRYVEHEFPVTYFLSADAVNLGSTPDFMDPGTSLCTACSFIEWGWWGGQPRLGAGNHPTVELLGQSIHLGTWVAGEIVFGDEYVTGHDLLALDNTGSASYLGHAVGTVVTIDPNDDDDPYQPNFIQYVAGGSVNLTWNFGTRAGTVLMHFDDRIFGGEVVEDGDDSAFVGYLFGEQLSGSINGAIVKGPNSILDFTGIIGNFGIYGVNYAATGIIAGAQNGATPDTLLPAVELPTRVLRAGSFYTPESSSNAIANPGAVGLVGFGSGEGEGSENQDVVAELGLNAAWNEATLDIDGPNPLSITLPFFNSGSSGTVPINEPGLYGTAYFGPGQFAAYMLRTDEGTVLPAGPSGSWAITPVSSDGAAEILIPALLADNSEITVLDSDFTGAVWQSATYEGFNLLGDPTLTLPDGILLTTGSANISTTNTLDDFQFATDTGENLLLSNLSQSIGGSAITEDQNVLTFEFTVPDGFNAVQATFVFATEEFDTETVTDIFGFFVDGTNYATLADGSPVRHIPGASMNTGYSIEYDGLTNVLTVIGLLDPSLSTHTLTIAIADTEDQDYDSGVFIGGLQAISYREPLYILSGIPTTIVPGSGGVFEGGGVRAYKFSEDVIQGIPVPFMRDIYGFTWAVDEEGAPIDYASTPLYVVNEHETDDFTPHVMQAWLAIEGSGAAQVSGIGVTVAAIFNETGDGIGFNLNAGRRGSFRSNAYHGSVTMAGAYSTLGGPNPGANQFFGPNAENFVVGTGGFANGDGVPNVAEVFNDWSLDIDANDGQFGTVHVATLVDDDVDIGSRTARTLTGFAAGIVDVVYETGCTAPGQGCGAWVPSQGAARGEVLIEFNPQRDRVGGLLTLNGAIPPFDGSLTIEFGRRSGQTDGDGKTAMVDDNIYAARESAFPENTFARLNVPDDQGTPEVEDDTPHTDIHQRSGEQANTYVVSADAVAIQSPDYMDGAEFCDDCAFMKWGWWGTTARFADHEEENDSVHVTTHLGTYVAGNASTHDEIDDYLEGAHETTDMQATYQGHVVGSVNNNGAQYVAGGSLEMTWQFATRQGTMDIENFDERSYSGSMTANAESGFSGNLTKTSGPGDIEGFAEGTFASDGVDPAAGVMGSFGLEGEDYLATGTFMGAHDGFIPIEQ